MGKPGHWACHAGLVCTPCGEASLWPTSRRGASSTLPGPPQGLPAAPSRGPPSRILSRACPGRHFLSGPGGSLPSLAVCKWPAPRTACPFEETAPCLARAQSAAGRAKGPPSRPWSPVSLWPWAGRSTRQSWEGGAGPGIPRSDPPWNQEGGQPQPDTVPPNTSPPLGTTEIPGEAQNTRVHVRTRVTCTYRMPMHVHTPPLMQNKHGFGGQQA